MGTEADLRKLKLSKARAVLRNFGVPEDEVREYQPVFAATNTHVLFPYMDMYMFSD